MKKLPVIALAMFFALGSTLALAQAGGAGGAGAGGAGAGAGAGAGGAGGAGAGGAGGGAGGGDPARDHPKGRWNNCWNAAGGIVRAINTNSTSRAQVVSDAPPSHGEQEAAPGSLGLDIRESLSTGGELSARMGFQFSLSGGDCGSGSAGVGIVVGLSGWAAAALGLRWVCERAGADVFRNEGGVLAEPVA